MLPRNVLNILPIRLTFHPDCGNFARWRTAGTMGKAWLRVRKGSIGLQLNSPVTILMTFRCHIPIQHQKEG